MQCLDILVDSESADIDSETNENGKRFNLQSARICRMQKAEWKQGNEPGIGIQKDSNSSYFLHLPHLPHFPYFPHFPWLYAPCYDFGLLLNRDQSQNAMFRYLVDSESGDIDSEVKKNGKRINLQCKEKCGVQKTEWRCKDMNGYWTEAALSEQSRLELTAFPSYRGLPSFCAMQSQERQMRWSIWRCTPIKRETVTFIRIIMEQCKECT